MKGLAWYTTIFSALFIIGLILNVAGLVARPPFTPFEIAAMIIVMVPVLILGIMLIRKSRER